MKTVFIGAVEGSLAALKALCDAGLAPVLIVTLPPELAHRHSDFADLSAVAQAYDIPVKYSARSDDEEVLQSLRDLAPDLLLVIGWSQICGAELRAIPRLGAIGFHPTALPKLRGRAVLPWTILRRETTTGATLFWLDEGTDTGDIAAQELFEIDPDTITARALYDRQLDALCRMLPALVRQIADGQVPRRVQDHSQASLCARRRPADGRINWRDPAEEIERLIRAVGPPYPGSFSHTATGEKLIITGARFTPHEGYYIGLPGQVQAIDGPVFTVACGDGRCLDIVEWHSEAAGHEGETPVPKLHSILGASQEDIR